MHCTTLQHVFITKKHVLARCETHKLYTETVGEKPSNTTANPKLFFCKYIVSNTRVEQPKTRPKYGQITSPKHRVS